MLTTESFRFPILRLVWHPRTLWCWIGRSTSELLCVSQVLLAVTEWLAFLLPVWIWLYWRRVEKVLPVGFSFAWVILALVNRTPSFLIELQAILFFVGPSTRVSEVEARSLVSLSPYSIKTVATQTAKSSHASSPQSKSCSPSNPSSEGPPKRRPPVTAPISPGKGWSKSPILVYLL